MQDNLLVLHSGISQNNCIWIFDVESYTWRTHFDQDLYNHMYRRHRHSVLTGLNGDVIILGGSNGAYRCTLDTVYKPLVNVRLWKNLKQLAMRIVYQNRTVVPWNRLPPKLIRKLMDTYWDWISNMMRRYQLNFFKVSQGNMIAGWRIIFFCNVMYYGLNSFLVSFIFSCRWFCYYMLLGISVWNDSEVIYQN